MEMIGYFGALLLAVCAFPQMIFSIKEGNSVGLSHGFLLSWYIGEILMLVFTVITIGTSGPLFYNFLANTVMLTVIVKYKYWPRI